jgi:hypothetical protein
MRLGAVALLAGLLAAPALFADEHNTDFDPKTDFSQFKTFVIREGTITAKAPELANPLVRKKIEDNIRMRLAARGLKEVENRPDLVVNFRFGAADKREVQSFPAGRWGRRRRLETFRFTEGTLIVNLMDRNGRDLVWRGVYRDDESNASKLSNKLPDDIKKLFSEYPPKKK